MDGCVESLYCPGSRVSDLGLGLLVALVDSRVFSDPPSNLSDLLQRGRIGDNLVAHIPSIHSTADIFVLFIEILVVYMLVLFGCRDLLFLMRVRGSHPGIYLNGFLWADCWLHGVDWRFLSGVGLLTGPSLHTGPIAHRWIPGAGLLWGRERVDGCCFV